MRVESSTLNWIEEEFKFVDFNDKRLVGRFKKIILTMTNKAQSLISSAFDSWADIKACYRFIENKKITLSSMLTPHKEKTLERIEQEKSPVLLIQDTSYFDYNSREKTPDLDYIMRHPNSGDPIEGLILHSTMAVTTDGLPLGLFDQRFIDRKSFHDSPRQTRHWNKRIEEKESFRWIEVIRDFKKQTQNEYNVIHVADREGDIYELYRDAKDLDEKFIIRAKTNRSINKKKRREPPKEKLFDLLESKRAQGRITIKLQVNHKKKYRHAELSIVYLPISIPPPPNKTVAKDGAYLPHVKVWAIMAIERNPPAQVKPIKWVLITNLLIDDIDQAIEKVVWYSYRWNIEIFHKIIKSGCSVEKSQLRTAERLKKYIILKSIIAWRIFWLSRTFRLSCHQSCVTVLSEEEWKILYRKVNKKSPPQVPPKIEEVYYWIAKLGGYIGRKSDPPPGVISVWRGWTRFMEVIEDYHAFCG